MSFDGAHFALTSDAAAVTKGAPSADASEASFDSALSCPEEGAGFKRALAGNLLSASGIGDCTVDSTASDVSAEVPHRVLAFKNKAPAPPEGHTSGLKVLYSQTRSTGVPKVRWHAAPTAAPHASAGTRHSQLSPHGSGQGDAAHPIRARTHPGWSWPR
jgi:hypothetical protein